jgi:hypothetical protein
MISIRSRVILFNLWHAGGDLTFLNEQYTILGLILQNNTISYKHYTDKIWCLCSFRDGSLREIIKSWTNNDNVRNSLTHELE